MSNSRKYFSSHYPNLTTRKLKRNDAIRVKSLLAHNWEFPKPKDLVSPLFKDCVQTKKTVNSGLPKKSRVLCGNSPHNFIAAFLNVHKIQKRSSFSLLFFNKRKKRKKKEGTVVCDGI